MKGSRKICVGWIAFVLMTSTFGVPSPALAQQADPTASLRATYEEWIRAWNRRDIKTIAEISSDAFGFGRDVPFARSAAASRAAYENGLEGYMKLMDTISYEAQFTEYKVIGNTGFVWGFYGQTTKQITGPSRTVFGRQSLTFLLQDGKWRMVFYHRSALPNEFVR